MKTPASLLCLALGGAWLFSLTSARAASWTVLEQNFSFSPAALTITQGDTVTWTNVTAATPHTSTSGNPPGGDGLWNSGTTGGHQTFTLVATNLPPGTYPYFCSFHSTLGMTGAVTVASATLPPPSVSLTNPADGAAFRAPADITLAADASQTGGSVTNVEFFSDNNLLGNAAASPYRFTLSSAPAGNYAFSAVAMNNLGVSATSSVVNVFVLTNATLTDATLTNGHFQLTIDGIAGQTYATESSSNLIDWVPFATNVAPADQFNVTDPASSAATPMRFYRTRQDY